MAIQISRSIQGLRRFHGLLLFVLCVGLYPGCDTQAPPEDYIVLDPEEATLMVGQSLTLRPVTDVGLGMDEALEWSSAQPTIASVDQNGLVFGISPGMATITAVVFDVSDPDSVVATDSAQAVITIEPAIGGSTLLDGVFPTCSQPEAVNLIDRCNLAGGTADAFGDLAGGCLASIACGDRYRVVDLVSRETQFERETGNGFGSAFGTIGIENGANAALFTFGSQANVLCPAQEDGFCQFNVNSTTYDAVPAGGDPGTGEAVLVGPSRGVQFIEPISDGFGFGFRKESIPPNAFSGEPVSAWMPETGGTAPLLVLDRGQDSFLYEVEGETPSANPLNFGLDARRVRCEPLSNGSYFCAVSVFGDDRVGFTIWTVSNAPTSPSFADVGDGPVGIDIHETDGGRLFVVATGFNDNTVTEIEFFNQNQAPNVATRAVSSECQNPGHAAYAEDSEGLKVIYTCYGSDNYVVEDSRFN